MTDMVSQPTELIDTGAVVAKFQPSDTTDLIVLSFHHITKGSRAIWGGEFFQKNKIPVIGITDYRMTWYPCLDMNVVIPVLRPILSNYKKVVAYGHSMGAYGAMKYGRELEIDLALAFAPQHSIEPADVRGFDQSRADLHYQESLHKGMKIVPNDLPKRTLVFVDWRFRVDRRHAYRLPQDPAIQFVACPFAKHQPVEMLAKARLTKRMFDQVVDGQDDWKAMRQLVRSSRRGSTIYEENLSAYLRIRKGDINVAQLISDLASAKGASRALDRKIALSVGYRLTTGEDGRPTWRSPAGTSASTYPRYTDSVDEASVLARAIGQKHSVWLTFDRPSQARIGEATICTAATPALALCLAAMQLKLYRYRQRSKTAAHKDRVNN
jgi:hypothetical protein